MHDLEVLIFFIKLIEMSFIVILWGLFHKKAWKGREKAGRLAKRSGSQDFDGVSRLEVPGKENVVFQTALYYLVYTNQWGVKVYTSSTF